jgi:hypothetical protein
MLTKLGPRGDTFGEEAGEYRDGSIDSDSAPDPETSMMRANRQMSSTTLKRTGLVLLLAGIVGVAMTVVGML